MLEVYLDGKKLKLEPKNSKGKGGEAEVWKIATDKVVKIFKSPDHEDYEGNEPYQINNREGAKRRIAEHQKKLRDFPSSLPPRVVVPEKLVFDKSGQIIGYTMKLIDGDLLFMYANRNFREKGILSQNVLSMLLDLRETLKKLHDKDLVIGDFNDLNIIVSGKEAHLIDADSFQFGPYLCRNFTEKFLDPLLIESSSSEITLSYPYVKNSDWYAYNIMAMQSLLRAGPYDGSYRPKDKSKQIKHGLRPLKRITVFNSEVGYPKPALPLKILPDELLHYFQKVFEKDLREEFPALLLSNLTWKTCLVCGTEHLRSLCPECTSTIPSPLNEVITVKGKVVATKIFRTSGTILETSTENGDIKWIYNENDSYRREDGKVFLDGAPDPRMRLRIKGEETLLAKNGLLVTIRNDNTRSEKLSIDSFGNLPVFDSNEKSRFWLNNGELFFDGKYGPEKIGSVLQDQTLFWTGKKFGFGFYRVQGKIIAFVFDHTPLSLKEITGLPPIRGKLLDANVTFAEKMCWFLTSVEESGVIINRCFAIDDNGKILATLETKKEESDWLNNTRGKCATGKFLFSATDQGIVRVDLENGIIVKTREYPDTETFVDSASDLHLARGGICVVNSKDITLLKMD